MTLHITRQGSTTLLHNSHLLPTLPADFFSLAFWETQGRITGQAQGRGITRFLDYQGLALVWRRYRRGGLIGKLLKQHFMGLGTSRAELEFRLLLQLQALQLPVPAPVAARIERGLLFYQAEIMLLRIPGAHDLATLLQRQPLSADQWRATGQLIARFHHHRLYHSDLNSHNILLDRDDQLWLIDFDKCGFRDGEHWKVKNLLRLKRSLDKEKTLHPSFHFQDTDWQHLLAGYQAFTASHTAD